MAKNKDQNLDGGLLETNTEADSPLPDESLDPLEANPEQDLADIDVILTEEDPQFINQMSEIQIPAGTNIDFADTGLKADVVEITFLQQFKKMFNYSEKPKAVVSFWLAVLLGCGGIVYIWNSKRNLLKENLFLTSYASWNNDVHTFNPLTESEPFYDNQRFSRNLMTLSKMFINVRSSENSGTTPMLALEINVEGISSDAIIEIKDREAEFKDLLLRFTEERTYDELITTLGKQNLCDQFRIIINSHLSQGQVRRVLLKSFIIKP